MRKEIQHDSGRHTQLFAQQKGFRELAQGLLVGDDDQLINASPDKKFANFLLTENPDKVKSPDPMFFNLAGKIPGSLSPSHDGDMTYVQRSMSLESKKDEPVGRQEQVINNKCKNRNEAVPAEGVCPDEKLRRKQSQPGKRNPLGQAHNLIHRGRRDFRINT